MKKILLIICLAALSASVSAQSVNFGIKAGLNLSTVRASPSDPIEKTNDRAGFHVGAIADIGFKEFSLQPGLYYITKGNTFTTTYPASDGQQGMVEKGDTRLDYLELPVNVVYNLKIVPDVKMYFGAGGYLGYGLSGKGKATITGRINETFEDNFSFGGDLNADKNPDYGLSFIAGTRLKHFSIDVNYSLGLANILQEDGVNTRKNSAAGISLGYWYK